LNLLKLMAAVLVGCLGAAKPGAEVLLETPTSWDGGHLAYPEGQVRVTSAILRIDPGEQTAFHCHPVPTMGYVLSGSVEVVTAQGDKRRFDKGDALVEVMKTPHRGRAVDGPVELIVFYAGAEDVPNTVMPGSEEAKHWTCGTVD
jgi:quercetin dioxygenase-like cupin family protein